MLQMNPPLIRIMCRNCILVVGSVNAKNGRCRALPDDGMKICTKCNCGLLYNFRRVASKSRSQTGAKEGGPFRGQCPRAHLREDFKSQIV